MLTEMIVAIAILASVSIPIAYGVLGEQKLFRMYYYQSVAMQVVDGEMEILMAGEWRSYKAGEQVYAVKSEAAKNLPAGKFVLTVDDTNVRLEWLAEKPGKGGRVFREFKVKAS